MRISDWSSDVCSSDLSRLRYLGKPVEFWAVPNIERGSHTLQNPGQLLTLQERAMDWWLYWLKDEREPSETKREQYAGWDKLRRLRDEDAKRPRPPRLRWPVEPVAEIGREHGEIPVTNAHRVCRL